MRNFSEAGLEIVKIVSLIGVFGLVRTTDLNPRSRADSLLSKRCNVLTRSRSSEQLLTNFLWRLTLLQVRKSIELPS